MRLRAEERPAFDPHVEIIDGDSMVSDGVLGDEEDFSDEEAESCVVSKLVEASATVAVLKGALDVTDPAEGAKIEELRAQIFAEFGVTSLSGICPVDPPVRGPFGEAEIWLRPDAMPVSVPPYRFAGDRREAHAKLIDEIVKAGKVEPGQGAWNTPSFPVPKKRPGEFRLVQDLRPQNAATIKDGHPLPLIEAILQRQGKYRM